MTNGNSKLLPSVLGTQYPGAIPCGKKIPVNRVFGFAAAFFKGVCAGSMASRNGNATVTPAPYKNVRRGICFFVMNMTVCPLILMIARGFRAFALRKFHVVLEFSALHDAQNQR